jgi:hypothetical protein
MKTTTTVIHRLPITRARVNLGQLARRAHVNKEYFILEKDGFPVVGIMDADEMEAYLEMRDPAIRRQIQKSNADILVGRTRPAEVLLSELRRKPTTRKPSGKRR